MDKYVKASASYATNEARVIGFTTKYKQSNNVEAASLLAPHIKCCVADTDLSHLYIVYCLLGA